MEIFQMLQREGWRSEHSYPALYFSISYRRLMDEFRRGVLFQPMDQEAPALASQERPIALRPQDKQQVLQAFLQLHLLFHEKYGRMIFEKNILKLSNFDIASLHGMTEGAVSATISTKMKDFVAWMAEEGRKERYMALVHDLQQLEGWHYEWQEKYPVWGFAKQ